MKFSRVCVRYLIKVWFTPSTDTATMQRRLTSPKYIWYLSRSFRSGASSRIWSRQSLGNVSGLSSIVGHRCTIVKLDVPKNNEPLTAFSIQTSITRKMGCQMRWISNRQSVVLFDTTCNTLFVASRTRLILPFLDPFAFHQIIIYSILSQSNFPHNFHSRSRNESAFWTSSIPTLVALPAGTPPNTPHSSSRTKPLLKRRKD